MTTSSVAELSRALHARRLSSVELTGALLDRIDAANRTLNAFLTVDREGALVHARAADARIAAGTASKLTGIPPAPRGVPQIEVAFDIAGHGRVAVAGVTAVSP